MTDETPFNPAAMDDEKAPPGELIRTARERAGMSVEKLAQQLRLDGATVEALEADRYEGLAAPLFVRGYLRNVAKVLDVDEDKLLSRYERIIAADSQPELARVSQPEDSGGATHRAIQAGSAAIVVLSLALAFLWWQGSQDDAQPATGPAVTSEDPARPPGGTAALPPAPAPLPVPTEPAAPNLDPARDGTYGFAPDAPADATPFSPEVEGEEAAEPPVEAPEPAAPAGPAPDTVVILPREEAWVDVTDAAGTRLYFDMAPAGERMQLKGTPPFELVVGNATNVEVTYLGAPVELETRTGVARVTLGTPVTDDAGVSAALE